MKPIYLDYVSTTPLDPQVRELIWQYLDDPTGEYFGNYHASHYYGKKVVAAVETARQQVATLINGQATDIIWTSGATEANNLAIKGAAIFYQRQGKQIITSPIEHSSILACCNYLKTQGFEISYLKIFPDGLVDLEHLRTLLTRNTILISLAHANSELGTVQNIHAIGELARSKGILFHVDAAQSAGKIPIDVIASKVDLLSLSAHKLYGPKGIGALYLRSNPKLQLAPILHGGLQENRLRAGTLPVPQIVGMGLAFQLAQQRLEQDQQQQKFLITKLWQGISKLEEVQLNGSPAHCLPNLINVSFGGLPAGSLVTALETSLAVSTATACHTQALASNMSLRSPVLQTLGIKNELIDNTLRLSIGRFTTEAEIELAIAQIIQTVQRLRNSPV